MYFLRSTVNYIFGIQDDEPENASTDINSSVEVKSNKISNKRHILMLTYC